MKLINGRQIAWEVLTALKSEIQAKGFSLNLAAITIGGDSSIKKFVELKERAGQEAGIKVTAYDFSEAASQKEIEDLLIKLSNDTKTQGIFIELPIPKHFDLDKLLTLIVPKKDVDALAGGKVLPPALEALKIVLEKENISLIGKKAAVFGQGRLVGKPIADWLESQGLEVFRTDEHTQNPAEYSKQADVIVSGVGKPDLITQGMIKEGAIIVDFGYGRKNGKMVGDVSDDVSEKAGFLTPVPGGMGPVVIAAVLKNLFLLNS